MGTPNASDQAEIDALAEWSGLNLRLDHDESAPLPWAVWYTIPESGDEDILGAGESPSEAIEDARNTARQWAP